MTTGRLIIGLFIFFATDLVARTQGPIASLGAPQLPTSLTLGGLVDTALDNHPKLAKAASAVAVSQGRVVQAGLYPNPVVSLSWDELGDRQGPSGINTLPLIQQSIVLGNRLQDNRLVAIQGVEIRRLQLAEQKSQLMTGIRKAYLKAYAKQRRAELLRQIARLARQSYDSALVKRQAKEIAELDLIQFRLEWRRFQARLTAADAEAVAARRTLAALVGIVQLPPVPLSKPQQITPPLTWEVAYDLMLKRSPRLAAGRVKIQQAESTVRRELSRRIPDLTVGAGYVRQNQNNSDDWTLQFSMPLPIFDRNQGNVQAAKASASLAAADARQLELVLRQRLAAALGAVYAARSKVKVYDESILKDAHDSWRIASAAYKAGQFEYLRVVQAQRAYAEAQLERLDARALYWQAEADMYGLLNWANPDVPIPVPITHGQINRK